MQKELRSGSNNVDVRELLNGIYIIQITIHIGQDNVNLQKNKINIIK